MSGQRVNSEKSKLFILANILVRTARVLSANFGIPLTGDLGKYLGVPLMHNRMNGRMFGYVVEKMRKKLSGWKTKFLSKSTRSILIETTIVAIPAYSMQIVKLLVSVIEQVKQIYRSIFGERRNLKEAAHYVVGGRLMDHLFGGRFALVLRS